MKPSSSKARRRALLLLAVVVLQPFGARAADVNGDNIELILLPLAFTYFGQVSAGAFGSRWTGAALVYNGNATEASLTTSCPNPAPCSQQPANSFELMRYIADRPELGAVLSVNATLARNMTFSARLWELSRTGQPRGVDIPIVREGAFFDRPVVLLNVDVSPGVRASLRTFDPWVRARSPAPRLDRLDIEFFDLRGVLLTRSTLTPRQIFSGPGAQYYPLSDAIYDLAATVPEIARQSLVHIRVTPQPSGAQFYAMASVTDNDTQTVSIITAQ